MRIGKIIARPFFGSAHLLDLFAEFRWNYAHKKAVPLYDLRHSLICDFFTAIGYTFGLGPYSLVPGAES